MVSAVLQNGETALIYAVQDHHTQIVKVLLAAGADVNLQEKVNKTKGHRSGNFRCKNIFVVCVNHENKKHEIYLTTNINHYGQHILHTRFHNTASCSLF